MTLQHLIQNSLFPVGEENTAYAPYFDGTSYLHMLSLDQVAVGNVTFAPGCRNHWHIHKASQGGGQILLVTAGRGYYQAWGQPPQELHPGGRGAHSPQRQALARGRTGQPLPAPGH